MYDIYLWDMYNYVNVRLDPEPDDGALHRTVAKMDCLLYCVLCGVCCCYLKSGRCRTLQFYNPCTPKQLPCIEADYAGDDTEVDYVEGDREQFGYIEVQSPWPSQHHHHHGTTIAVPL